MNFNAPLFKPLRILLFPFSLIYGLIIWLRNRMYDKNIFRSTGFNKPLICVGNLSAGGTGKSPMVEYLVRLIIEKVPPAILSRGYKRRTKGYALANTGSTALEIGDEPMQFYLKFPGIAVAVGEERLAAVPQILHDRPETGVIILDDAFQHRAVKAGLNILLTDFNDLFTRDWFLPTGNLRDEARSYKRADVIVVTKCPENLSEEERKNIVAEIAPRSHQQVFFTRIAYGTPYHILTGETISVDESLEVLLVSGIANPAPLKKYLAGNTAAYFELMYSDHHIFSTDDWKEIVERYHRIPARHKIIITTEKDAVRLIKYKQHLMELPFYVIPIQSRFLFGDGPGFNNIITTFIEGFDIKNNKN
ncbi:MAG: tetraacyldisaccharide 4'-kinase [Chitinophagaceae bacterium]|nr:MAG: tetraacyldisaccharide 4'-kinase [Chitinophagaceae bacterium]